MNTLDKAIILADFCISEKIKPSDLRQLITLVRRVHTAETRKLVQDDPGVWSRSEAEADKSRSEADKLMNKYGISLEWNSTVPTLFRGFKRLVPGFSFLF